MWEEAQRPESRGSASGQGRVGGAGVWSGRSRGGSHRLRRVEREAGVGGCTGREALGEKGGHAEGGSAAGSVCARLGGRTAPGVWGRGRPLGPERSLGPRAGRGHQGVDTGKAGPRCFSRRRRALKAGPGQTAEWEATGPQAECASKPGAEKKQSTGRLSRRDERRRTRSPRAASTQLQHPFPSLPALASVSHKTLDSWYDCHLEQRQWMPEGTQ